MQPQGLEALMPQGAAGPQPQAPQMGGPRLAAAMDLVTSDAEEQVLDPRTLAVIKYKDAVEAMQAADRLMAASQPAPTPPTVAERTKLAAEQGLAGLAARLSPGIQQRGNQLAAQELRQAMGGGLPQLSAPNMAGMADGGIVGYQVGGAVSPAPTPSRVIPRPIPRGQPNAAAQAGVSDDVARYLYQYNAMRSSLEAARNPQERAAIEQRLRAMQQSYDPNIVAEAHMKMGSQGGMAGGGVVAFSRGGRGEDVGPDMSEEGFARRAAYEALGGSVAPVQTLGGLPELLRRAATLNMPERNEDEIAVAPEERSEYDQKLDTAQMAALENAMRLMESDPEEAARVAGVRLQELAGVKELMDERKAEQQRLRELQESRFSPEETRRRLLRAGLASGARSGLGGFGAGISGEEERIATERQSVQERAVADMDKLIADLRAMGLSQFEAENTARTQIQNLQAQGMTAAQGLASARQQAETARAQMDTQRDVARIQSESPTDFVRDLDIRVNAMKAENPELSEVELRRRALEDRIADGVVSQLAAAGIQANNLQLDIIKTASKMASDRVAADLTLSVDPVKRDEQYHAYYKEAVEEITNRLNLDTARTGGGSGQIPSPPPGFNLD